MAEPVLRVEGARQLRRTLKGVSPELLDQLKTAHRQAAEVAAARGRQYVPRRSGALAASIRPGATKTAAIVRAGKARVPYAGPIHWGWPRRHIKAQPFLTQAAQDTEPTWVELYHRAVLAVLDTIEGA